MSRSRSAVLPAALAAGIAVGLAAGRPAAQSANPLPPGEHMTLVLGACIMCHSPEMVAQQRLDRATWQAIVDRMITYGAPITPETRPLILEYLATRLGP
jgi:Spy/CpxP family protein refolding chaperone